MSSPSTTATPSSRLSTPTAPVVIPVKGQHDATHERSRHGKKEKRMRNVHSPDAVPPSVAALLALTSIPPSRGSRRQGGQGQRLTVNAILEHTRASEKQSGISLGKSHLHLLLSPPEEDPEVTESETGCESLLSRRTTWSESVPSLEDDGSISEAISEASPSFGSLVTPGFRGRRTPPKRKQSLLLPLSVPSEDHPLSVVNVEEMDFRVFRKMGEEQERPDTEATPQRKSAFKSNLTASLRALKSAAKSFSSLTTPLITPDDFLTRSIISIDPQVPFTDERMPSLEDTPTPALRRYLNPTSNPPGEAHVSASIQMQTYKISRTGKSTSPSVISRRTVPTPEEGTEASVPFIRQRDMRENSDFIRVAVMEMLMRKKGKLDNQKPGRARWALPPRKPSGPYEISVTGIPARWVSVTN
ncbi:hypothetical protein LZ554_006949 [Drepanopeziza brunnea f. sp. 'monogermtubi']|nr:hypothetical protein LZ554_006949 [Drepanopeziza brunnea f. sp. 'monogermtubi']